MYSRLSYRHQSQRSQLVTVSTCVYMLIYRLRSFADEPHPVDPGMAYLRYGPGKASRCIGMGMFLCVVDGVVQTDYSQGHGLHLVPRIASESTVHYLMRMECVSFHDQGMVFQLVGGSYNYWPHAWTGLGKVCDACCAWEWMGFLVFPCSHLHHLPLTNTNVWVLRVRVGWFWQFTIACSPLKYSSCCGKSLSESSGDGVGWGWPNWCGLLIWDWQSWLILCWLGCIEAPLGCLCEPRDPYIMDAR